MAYDWSGFEACALGRDRRTEVARAVGLGRLAGGIGEAEALALPQAADLLLELARRELRGGRGRDHLECRHRRPERLGPPEHHVDLRFGQPGTLLLRLCLLRLVGLLRLLHLADLLHLAGLAGLLCVLGRRGRGGSR